MGLKKIAFEFAERCSDLADIASIILFGSVARGEERRDSDLDILVVFESVKIRKESASEVSKIALDLEKEHDVDIGLVTANKIFDGLDSYFLNKVFQEGKVIYGKNMQILIKKLKLNQYSIIYFSLAYLSLSEKMKVKRALYGYKTVKFRKGKKYTTLSEGLIKELEAQRLGPACILVPYKKAKDLIKTLTLFKAEYKRLDVWLPEF